MIEMGRNIHKDTLEKVEILKRYYPTESYDFILEQFQKAGIARGFSRNKIRDLAWRYGIKRLSVTDKIIKEEFIKIKTPWDIRLAKPIYSAHKITAVWCSYKTDCDRDVMLRLPVDGQALELMEVEKKTVSKMQLKGLEVNEFLCWRCNIIYDRSYARQKGVSGGNKCKACYNLGRKEEKEKNPQARIKSYLHSYTDIAYTGVSCGSPCHAKPGSKLYEMIGCTTAEFRKHIENQLQEGWSHEDRGNLWEIDHIIPYNNFDLTDSEQVKQVMHYTNVRPLSIKENRTKRDKLV